MKRNAIIGGIAWCSLFVAARENRLDLSWIEELFLFAPLVIVPLGLELTSRLEQGSVTSLPERIARFVHAPAALLTVASFFFAPGELAAGLAGGWFVFCALLALSGFIRLLRGRLRALDAAFPAVAFLYLPVGAAWLVASRLGLKPLDFHEPIVLLTAVHFHYAGFAAALLARPAGRALANGPARRIGATLFRVLAIVVLLGPAILAAAFIFGPKWKLLAAMALAIGEIGLAVYFFLALRKVMSLLPKLLIGLAATSVAFSMVLSAVWALGEYPLQPFVGLDEMARLHGTTNAFGFTFCGLLGWMIWADSLSSQRSGHR